MEKKNKKRFDVISPDGITLSFSDIYSHISIFNFKLSYINMKLSLMNIQSAFVCQMFVKQKSTYKSLFVSASPSGWACLVSNQGPPDYESGALTV